MDSSSPLKYTSLFILIDGFRGCNLLNSDIRDLIHKNENLIEDFYIGGTLSDRCSILIRKIDTFREDNKIGSQEQKSDLKITLITYSMGGALAAKLISELRDIGKIKFFIDTTVLISPDTKSIPNGEGDDAYIESLELFGELESPIDNFIELLKESRLSYCFYNPLDSMVPYRNNVDELVCTNINGFTPIMEKFSGVNNHQEILNRPKVKKRIVTVLSE